MQLSRLWTEGRHELPALPLSALREGRWQPSGELSLPRLRKGWWKAFRLLLLSGVRRGRLTDFEFRKARTRLREIQSHLELLRTSLVPADDEGRATFSWIAGRIDHRGTCRGLAAHRLALPQIPGAFVASETFGLGGFAGIEISDVAAERHGLCLQFRIHLQVITASHRLRQRIADHHCSMAAHQRGGLVATRTGERGAECRGFHRHVGVARDLADVEYRHTPSYEACHVVDRPERDVACAERDDRRSVVVHHGLDFGPDLVDFSMNEALEVHSGVASIHRLAVEAELQDVVRGHRLRGDRARNEITVW